MALTPATRMRLSSPSPRARGEGAPERSEGRMRGPSPGLRPPSPRAAGRGQRVAPSADPILCQPFLRFAFRCILAAHLRQPPMRVGRGAAGDVEIAFLDGFRNSSSLAVADANAVETPHGRDLRRRTGEEDLVGGVKRLARYLLLTDADSEVIRDRQHAVSGDAGQQRAVE